MSYFWNVTIDGKSYQTKAVKVHTAVSGVLKVLGNQKYGKINYQRGAVVKRILCDCGAKYDEDEKERHQIIWKHKQYLENKGGQNETL